MIVRTGSAPLSIAKRKDRMRARMEPALLRVLEEHNATESVPVGELVDAILAQLIENSARLTARELLFAESGGHPMCWVCGLEIPLDAPEDSAECFSVDHVVPQSLGGTQLGIVNLRAAHRLCNAIRHYEKPSEKVWKHLREMKKRLEHPNVLADEIEGAAVARRGAADVFRDTRDVDGAEQKSHARDRGAILGAEADGLPELLQHGVGQIAVADRGAVSSRVSTFWP